MAIEHGGQVPDSIAALYLTEYAARLELRKLGFTDSLDDLDCITAEAFLLISQQYAAAQRRALKRHGK